MDEQAAKELVVKAGLELVRSGLIVRTWGNVSCRIDDERFAVTPSGRAYETLKPADIVVCRIADASWSGDVTPSKEKGVHALIYRIRKGAGFVIHTHQKYASAAASSSISMMHDEEMGDIPTAAYGLPGMKKLMRGVEAALAQSNGAVLMSHHGTVCFGPDYETTFSTAHELEQASERFMHDSYLKASGAKDFDNRQMLDYYIDRKGRRKAADAPYGWVMSSRRKDGGFITVENGVETKHAGPISNMPEGARLHAAVYAARPDVNNIECTANENVAAVSLVNQPLQQLLDDFAQMMGSPMRIAEDAHPHHVLHALKKRNGVLIPGLGALCCAATQGDAHALCLVTEKDALAEICASMVGTPKPISAIECFLMHLVYSKSYSKQAQKQS